MSVPVLIEKLAYLLSQRHEQYLSISENGITSSHLTFKDRRKRIQWKIWEKLIFNKGKTSEKITYTSEVPAAAFYSLFEAFTNERFSSSTYAHCFELLQQVPGKDSFPVIEFILLLSNSEVENSIVDEFRNILSFRFNNDKPKCAERVKLSTPSIDWKEASSFPDSKVYRTWDNCSFRSQPQIEHASRYFDYWHRSRVLLAETCFTSHDVNNYPTDFLSAVEFETFRESCVSLLLACHSEIFYYDTIRDEYRIHDDTYVAGLSHDCLRSLSFCLYPLAISFRKLSDFVLATERSITDKYSGFIANWYTEAVKAMLCNYISLVLQVIGEKSESHSLFTFVQKCRHIRKKTDIVDLCNYTNEVNELISASSNPWLVVQYVFNIALSASWQTDESLLNQETIILEQHLFGQVLNPLFARLSIAVFLGLTKSQPQLTSFGFNFNAERLSCRNCFYWLHGFSLDQEMLKEIPDMFQELLKTILSAGRSIDFLTICKPSHYLVDYFESSVRQLPTLHFFPLNLSEPRREYLNMHNNFSLEVEQIRDSSRKYLEEIRLLIIKAVTDKIEAFNNQLKERDEAMKELKLEEQRLKLERKRQLRDEQLAETASRRAALATQAEKEKRIDAELVRQLAQEEFTRTELERRLAEEEKKSLIKYYAELEQQAQWRRFKAEWRVRRLQLTEDRLRFFKEVLSKIWTYDDSVVKAERAPIVVRGVSSFEPEDLRKNLSFQIESIVDEEPISQKEIGKANEEDKSNDMAEVVIDISHENLGERIQPSPADDPVVPAGGKVSPRIILMNELGEPEEVEIITGRELLNFGLEAEPEKSEVADKRNQDTSEIIVKQINVRDNDIENSEVEMGNEDSENIPQLFKPQKSISIEVFKANPDVTLARLIKREQEFGINETVTKSDSETITFSQLFNRCILNPAKRISEITNMAVLEYLKDELDVIGHLSALRRYMLMDAGEFAIALSLPIFEALHSSKPNEYDISKISSSMYFLENTLGKAVNYISSPLSDLLCEERTRAGNGDHVFSLQQDFTQRLRISKKQSKLNPSKPFCFDDLELGYAVDWPLNIVLPSEDIRVYSKVFSFLLEMCRVVYVLDGCLQKLEDCQIGATKNSCVGTSTTLSALRLAHHARTLMRFFFTSIQTYLTSHVLRSQWEQLQTDVNNCRSLDDLRKVHLVYLKSLEKRCFLTQSTKTFRSIIGRLIKCVLDFEGELCAATATVIEGSGPVKKATVSKIKTISDDFKSNSRHFVSIAAVRLAQFDRLGFLDRLLLQLTFNDYYSFDNNNNLDATL